MRGSHVYHRNDSFPPPITPEDQINTQLIMGRISQNKHLYLIGNLQYCVVVTLIIQLQLFQMS